MDIQKDLKEDRLPHGCELLEQLGINGSGPRPPSRPKLVQHIMICDRCCKPAVEKDCDRFIEELYKSNPTEVPLPFWD